MLFLYGCAIGAAVSQHLLILLQPLVSCAAASCLQPSSALHYEVVMHQQLHVEAVVCARVSCGMLMFASIRVAMGQQHQHTCPKFIPCSGCGYISQICSPVRCRDAVCGVLQWLVQREYLSSWIAYTSTAPGGA